MATPRLHCQAFAATRGFQGFQGVLASKYLTKSDTATDVSRTGRIVLPRNQVQRCLPTLLQLGGAGHAVGQLGAYPLHLAADMAVLDRSGREFRVILRTWQNMVCGPRNPTFVLEQTAAFLAANNLRQGDSFGIAVAGGRLCLVSGVAVESCGRPAGEAASRRAVGHSREEYLELGTSKTGRCKRPRHESLGRPAHEAGSSSQQGSDSDEAPSEQLSEGGAADALLHMRIWGDVKQTSPRPYEGGRRTPPGPSADPSGGRLARLQRAHKVLRPEAAQGVLAVQPDGSMQCVRHPLFGNRQALRKRTVAVELGLPLMEPGSAGQHCAALAAEAGQALGARPPVAIAAAPAAGPKQLACDVASKLERLLDQRQRDLDKRHAAERQSLLRQQTTADKHELRLALQELESTRRRIDRQQRIQQCDLERRRSCVQRQVLQMVQGMSAPVQGQPPALALKPGQLTPVPHQTWLPQGKPAPVPCQPAMAPHHQPPAHHQPPPCQPEILRQGAAAAPPAPQFQGAAHHQELMTAFAAAQPSLMAALLRASGQVHTGAATSVGVV